MNKLVTLPLPLMNNDSVFRKWDLHIHVLTAYEHNFCWSNDQEKYKGNIWDKYIDEVEKISNIKIIVKNLILIVHLL